MLRRLLSISPENSTLNECAMTALRVYAGLALALGHGFGKLPPSEQFIGGVAQLGFPAPILFAWAAGLAEGVGGVCLALGLLTRPSAFFIACTMGVAGFLRHASDPFKMKELALFYLVVAMLFLAKGAGRFSLDRYLGRP